MEIVGGPNSGLGRRIAKDDSEFGGGFVFSTTNIILLPLAAIRSRLVVAPRNVGGARDGPPPATAHYICTVHL